MRRAVTTKSKYSTDLNLVLNLPLYETGLKANIFASYDIYAHKCSVFGATWGLQGRTFNGTTDYIDCGTSSVLLGLSTYTIETWVKLSNTNLQLLFGFPVALGSQYFSPRWDNTTQAVVSLSVYGDAARYFTMSPAIDTNWHHIIFEVTNNDITTAAMYIDLAAQAVASTVSTGTPTSKTGCIIGTGVGQHLNGIDGEMRIYNYLLSVSEKRHNYLATKWRYGV